MGRCVAMATTALLRAVAARGLRQRTLLHCWRQRRDVLQTLHCGHPLLQRVVAVQPLDVDNGPTAGEHF